jgi:hypothetical protein
VLLSYVPKANPRGLSTSSYAAPPPVVNPPLAAHAGDVTAPVGVHMGEEEKQKLREKLIFLSLASLVETLYL